MSVHERFVRTKLRRILYPGIVGVRYTSSPLIRYLFNRYSKRQCYAVLRRTTRVFYDKIGFLQKKNILRRTVLEFPDARRPADFQKPLGSIANRTSRHNFRLSYYRRLLVLNVHSGPVHRQRLKKNQTIFQIIKFQVLLVDTIKR